MCARGTPWMQRVYHKRGAMTTVPYDGRGVRFGDPTWREKSLMRALLVLLTSI